MGQSRNAVYYVIICVILFSCSKNPKETVKLIETTGGTHYSIEHTEQVVVSIGDCASYHGPDLRDTEGGSSLAGTGFIPKWRDKSVGKLFTYTKNGTNRVTE